MLTRRAFAGVVTAGLAALAVRPARAAAAPTLLARARAAHDSFRAQIAAPGRIGIADYARHSRDLRFHIVDLVSGQDWSFLVAHGRGSDPEHSGILQTFSNVAGSLASSSGSFVTTGTYSGQHGQSMRLAGLEPSNSNAEPRAIVIHGAPYVGEDHIAEWGKLGRSEGCFVFAPHRLNDVLTLLGPGRLIYADKV